MNIPEKKVLLNQIFKNARKDIHNIEIYKKEVSIYANFTGIVTYSYFLIGEIEN